MAAPLECLDAREHKVLFIHELAFNERFEEELLHVRVDLAALLDPVVEEEAVDVGLLGPARCFEVLLLAHEFGWFCLLVCLGLFDVLEDVGVFFLESVLSLEVCNFGLEVLDLLEEFFGLFFVGGVFEQLHAKVFEVVPKVWVRVLEAWLFA